MRQMKKFSDAIVAWYMNWSVFISSAIVVMGILNDVVLVVMHGMGRLGVINGGCELRDG